MRAHCAGVTRRPLQRFRRCRTRASARCRARTPGTPRTCGGTGEGRREPLPYLGSDRARRRALALQTAPSLFVGFFQAFLDALFDGGRVLLELFLVLNALEALGGRALEHL